MDPTREPGTAPTQLSSVVVLDASPSVPRGAARSKRRQRRRWWPLPRASSASASGPPPPPPPPSRPRVRPCSPPGCWLLAGAIVLLGGVVMAALGYWHRDAAGAAGSPGRGGPARSSSSSSSSLSSSSSGFVSRSQKLRVLGPVTMGVGIFILICANAVLQENRGERPVDEAPKSAVPSAAAAAARSGEVVDPTHPVKGPHGHRSPLLRLLYPVRGRRRASTVGPSPEPGVQGLDATLATGTGTESGPLGSGPLASGPLGSGPLGSGPLGSGPPGSGPPGSGPPASGPPGSGPLASGPLGTPGAGVGPEPPACTAVSMEEGGPCRDGEEDDDDDAAEEVEEEEEEEVEEGEEEVGEGEAVISADEYTRVIVTPGGTPLPTPPDLGVPPDPTGQGHHQHHQQQQQHQQQQMVTLGGRHGSRGRDDFWLVL
ncbi:unnamed protein product [Lampetra fluviatilis]